MSLTYRFRHQWRLPAAWHEVYDVLADVGSYAAWWPQVRSVERIDESTADVVCRSALPYRLRFRAAAKRQDRRAGVLEAALAGDLEGWCRWTVAAAGTGSDVTFEQQVVTRGILLHWLGRAAQPALRLNHAWMMRAGRRGLLHRLA